MAISTFSFFLPLPFFAAAGGFGGAAAFGALGAFGAFFGAPAAPTRASVLLRSSMAASEARALMIVAGGSPCLWEATALSLALCAVTARLVALTAYGAATALSFALSAVTARAACWECYCISRTATTAGMPSFARCQDCSCVD